MKLSNILRSAEGGRILFWCPGCGEAHMIRVEGEGPGKWGYNGNPEAPTFTPSILVRTVRLKGGDEELDRILDTYKLPEDRERVLADKRISWVCHSFVNNGAIQFLSDCSHELAGKTVPLPDYPRGEE